VNVPTVIGSLRPVILVPVEFLTGLPAGHVTALLAHELAHVRRRDYLASILQSIAEAVLFYHPAVWWISEQIRAERELCCDDLAVAATGDMLTYARALAELESRQPSRLKPALAANDGSLVTRIRRLIEPPQASANNLPGPAAAWAMTLLWLAGVGVAALHAGQTPAPVVNFKAADFNVIPLPALPRPMDALASHVRNTLLYDPFLSAQLAQPQVPGATNGAQTGDTLETPWRKWLDEDVTYIITAEERRAFSQLTTDEEREQFIEQFWLRRDPTPNTVENEFKQEHYRRITFANEHFSSGIPGWKTDRGRIYVTFGPPDEIDAHPSGGSYRRPAAEGGGETTTFPFEDWRYRYIGGVGNDVMIEFVDTRMNGDYHMTMDPSEKDALKYVPDARFKELEDAIGAPNTYTILPMQVRIDYVRATESAVMTNISIQFENRELQFQAKDGGQKSVVNILGRLSTMTRRPVTRFEKPLEINAPPGLPQTYAKQHSAFQQSVPLAPGEYRLNIVARDMVSGNLNSYEAMLDVPRFDEDKLSSSSLILADTIEKLPAKTFGGAMFAIGGTNVRPRLGTRFTQDEKMGIYLQVYNFGHDGSTQRPSGSIEYEIDKAGSNQRVMDFSEEAGTIANASTSQVTIEKMLPLRTCEEGSYTLKVTVTDRIGNQTLQRQGNFTVSLE
jgi:GWxTD domain-containing protein